VERAQRKTSMWGPTLLAAPAGRASATEHPVEPDTGAKRRSVQAPGLQVDLTQVLPEPSIALFLARGLPRAAAERYAAAPGIALDDLDGGRTERTTLRGRAVLVSFCATWCSPGRRERSRGPSLGAAQGSCQAARRPPIASPAKRRR
jgi:hypothetical protein